MKRQPSNYIPQTPVITLWTEQVGAIYFKFPLNVEEGYASMSNTPVSSSDDTWAKLLPAKEIPRNEDERRERELVNALWKHVEGNTDAEHILTSLVCHYNTINGRLKFSLDRLADKFAENEAINTKQG